MSGDRFLQNPKLQREMSSNHMRMDAGQLVRLRTGARRVWAAPRFRLALLDVLLLGYQALLAVAVGLEVSFTRLWSGRFHGFQLTGFL